LLLLSLLQGCNGVSYGYETVAKAKYLSAPSSRRRLGSAHTRVACLLVLVLVLVLVAWGTREVTAGIFPNPMLRCYQHFASSGNEGDCREKRGSWVGFHAGDVCFGTICGYPDGDGIGPTVRERSRMGCCVVAGNGSLEVVFRTYPYHTTGSDRSDGYRYGAVSRQDPEKRLNDSAFALTYKFSFPAPSPLPPKQHTPTYKR